MRAVLAWAVVLMVGCNATSGANTRPETAETRAIRPAASAAVLQAETLISQTRFDQARVLLEAELARDENNARAWLDLGLVFEASNDAGGAERSYRAATRAAPKFPEPYNNLGVVLRDKGALVPARVALQRAVSLDSRFAAAHLNLAMTHEDLGDLSAASASYKRAIELAPTDLHAHVNLGLLRLQQGDHADARQLLSSAVPLARSDVHWLAMIGSGLRRAGAPRDAIVVLQKANSDELERPDRVWAELGLAHYAVGELDTSERYLRNASTASPNDVALHYALGAVLLKNRKADEGRTLLERVIRDDTSGVFAERARRRLDADAP